MLAVAIAMIITSQGVKVKNKTLKRSYWLGYLAGIVNGISQRGDVPEDIRDNCKKIVRDYKIFSKGE